MKRFFSLLVLLTLVAIFVFSQDAPQRRRWPRREAFQTDTPMVHDPVMAWENGTYYLYSTAAEGGLGMDQAQATALVGARPQSVIPTPQKTPPKIEPQRYPARTWTGVSPRFRVP